VVCAVATAGCSPRGASERPQQPPRIVFLDPTHDFGHVSQGTAVTHAFVFRNVGGLDLTIENVRASCGCTAAVTSGRVIPPGGTASIETTYDTTRDFGRKTWSVTVYANDPSRPVTTLALVGQIDAEAAADPPQLYVGHLARGQTARNEVRLLAARSVTLGPIVGTGKVVEASTHPARQDARDTRLAVAIKPNAPAGRFNELISVRTSSPRQPIMTIPVIGIVDSEAPAPGEGIEKKP
jgi:hypothetical protein